MPRSGRGSVKNSFRTIEVSQAPNIYPGFVHLMLHSLLPETFAPCTLYLEAFNPHLKRLRLVPAMDVGSRIDNEWLEGLLSEGVSHFYVAWDDLDAMIEYLYRQTRRLLAATPDQGTRHRLLYEITLCSVKAALMDPRNGRRLALGVESVKQVIDEIWEEDTTRKGLLRVMSSDREVFTHSVNVGILGVAFARALGWPKEKVRDLGVGLFFHDLGLVEPSQDQDTYTQPQLSGQLAREEELTDHPWVSRRFLSQVPQVSTLSLQTVLTHHENIDGSGFPQGLAGDDLADSDRLGRMVDFYEYHTSGCGKAEGLSPYVVLKYMREEMAAKVDQDMLTEFIKFLGKA